MAKYKSFLIFLGIFCGTLLYGETDSLKYHHYDKDGKKHGYWKVYVDTNFNPVDDSLKAVWYYYRLYYHGQTFIGYSGDFIGEKLLEKVVYQHRPPIEKGKILPINGLLEVKMGKDKPHQDMTFSGKTIAVETKTDKSITHRLSFKAGHFTNYLILFGQYGTNWERMDYENQQEGNPYSYHYESPAMAGSKLKRGYIYFSSDKKKVQRSFTTVEVKSVRYDADSLSLLFNGLYKGDFTADVASSPTSRLGFGSVVTIRIDSGKYYYEDYYQKVEGSFSVSGDSLSFKSDEVIWKMPETVRTDFIHFQGVYRFRAGTKKDSLIKSDGTDRITYQLRPHVFYR